MVDDNRREAPAQIRVKQIVIQNILVYSVFLIAFPFGVYNEQAGYYGRKMLVHGWCRDSQII
jgi:hypothetical protein